MIEILQSIALEVILVALTPLIVAFMFLPAIIELHKPQDSGPRLIADSLTQTILCNITSPIVNIEDEWRHDEQLTVRVLNLDFPNLETYFI